MVTPYGDQWDDHGMYPLPQAADLTSLVLRTDFRDDAAWAALETAIDGSGQDCATFVSDPAYAPHDVPGNAPSPTPPSARPPTPPRDGAPDAALSRPVPTTFGHGPEFASPPQNRGGDAAI